jgi:hypothetical protein
MSAVFRPDEPGGDKGPDNPADKAFDDSIRAAVSALLEDLPDLLEPPSDFLETTLEPETFTDRLINLVRVADASNLGQLKAPELASHARLSTPFVRAILGRHPLIPRVVATRAAIEVCQEGHEPLTLVLKLFASQKSTTKAIRGVHRATPGGPGRHVHLDLVLITRQGRAVMVHSERFGFGDVIADKLAAVRDESDLESVELHIKGSLRKERADETVAQWLAKHWGDHASGAVPLTVLQHVEAVFGLAIDGAKLAGVPKLYQGVPLVGGQLVAARRSLSLPASTTTPLVGHDVASVDRLVRFGIMPTLDLNMPAATHPRSVSDLPYTFRRASANGQSETLTGNDLLRLMSDSATSTQVPPRWLGLTPGSPLEVSYLDAQLDLPSGAQPVRIFFRQGFGPHNLYLTVMQPEDGEAHRQALAAVVADSTSLYDSRNGTMTSVEKVCAKKGAYEPGGLKASPMESLAAIGRLAADRELHRRFRETR